VEAKEEVHIRPILLELQVVMEVREVVQVVTTIMPDSDMEVPEHQDRDIEAEIRLMHIIQVEVEELEVLELMVITEQTEVPVF